MKCQYTFLYRVCHFHNKSRHQYDECSFNRAAATSSTCLKHHWIFRQRRRNISVAVILFRPSPAIIIRLIANTAKYYKMVVFAILRYSALIELPAALAPIIQITPTIGIIIFLGRRQTRYLFIMHRWETPFQFLGDIFHGLGLAAIYTHYTKKHRIWYISCGDLNFQSNLFSDTSAEVQSAAKTLHYNFR